MKLNQDWVYRDIHDYNILINIKTNDILRLSPLIGMLFANIKSNNLDEELLNFKVINNIYDDVKVSKLIAYFKSKGVFIDE